MPEFIKAASYADDTMNLPVGNVEAAIPVYETVMRFNVVSRSNEPCNSVVLDRDRIQIGLAENGGDPTQQPSDPRARLSPLVSRPHLPLAF